MDNLTFVQQLMLIFVTGVLGTGIWGFIGGRFKRKDEKEDKEDKVIKRLDDMQENFTEQIKDVKADVQNLSERHEEAQAVLARTHILRFNDELLNDVKHSHEMYLQSLDDLATYDEFCKSHPKFKNGRTVQAGENIRRTYERLFDNHKI